MFILSILLFHFILKFFTLKINPKSTNTFIWSLQEWKIVTFLTGHKIIVVVKLNYGVVCKIFALHICSPDCNINVYPAIYVYMTEMSFFGFERREIVSANYICMISSPLQNYLRSNKRIQVGLNNKLVISYLVKFVLPRQSSSNRDV